MKSGEKPKFWAAMPPAIEMLLSVKPRPHQQQCRSNNIVECYEVECCFDKVERCFDIVAQKRQLPVGSCQLLRHCCFDIVAGVDRAYGKLNSLVKRRNGQYLP